MLKYAKVILLFAIPLMVTFKIYQLNKIEFDIDVLGKQLTPLQTYIKPNSVIGFYANSNDPALFVEMQYIMAPQNIWNKITPDTLLLIQFPDKEMKTFDHYRTITRNQHNGMIVSLITRLK